jgi:hypothetical protein
MATATAPAAPAAPKRASAKRADPDLATVTRLLAAGQTSTINAATGRSQALYAKCPNDGGQAQVRRVSREGRGAIFEVTMRCTQCSTDFVAKPESLYLR